VIYLIVHMLHLIAFRPVFSMFNAAPCYVKVQVQFSWYLKRFASRLEDINKGYSIGHILAELMQTNEIIPHHRCVICKLLTVYNSRTEECKT
jgi:hypothetical protein